MRFIQVLAMLALFGFAGWASVASADDPSTTVSQQEATGAAGPKSREMVCRREQVLGSHMQRKVCRTRGEIEAEREAAQSAVRDLRDQSARGAAE